MRKIEERQVIEAFAEAIARMEGFYAPPRNGIYAIARRLNNPGNLRSWKDPSGAPYPTEVGFAKFPDADTGWRALRAQCRINIVKKQLTAKEFFGGKPGVYYGYAPRADKNDPDRYARFVVDRLTSALGVNCSLVLSGAPVATLIGLEVA